MSDKKAQSVAVATTTVSQGIELVNAELKTLKHIQDSVYVTSGKIAAANGTVDIKTETNKDILVTGLSVIIAKKNAKEAAYEALGIANYPVVKIDGSTEEEWVKDITLRIAIIDQKDRMDELNAIKKEYEALMDKEDRLAILNKKVQKFAEGSTAATAAIEA